MPNLQVASVVQYISLLSTQVLLYIYRSSSFRSYIGLIFDGVARGITTCDCIAQHVIGHNLNSLHKWSGVALRAPLLWNKIMTAKEKA
jgi:hypothetical protein